MDEKNNKEIEQIVAKPSKESAAQNASISSNMETIAENLTSKSKDNLFSKLINTVEKTSAISLALQAAAAGFGKKIGGLASFARGKYDSLISSKFSTVFKDSINANKDENREENAQISSKQTNITGGKKEIDDLVSSVVNIVKKFDEIKDKAKSAKDVLGDVSKLDFAKGIMEFVKQFNDDRLRGFITNPANPEYLKFVEKRDLLKSKINSEVDPTKRERYLQMLNNIKAPKDILDSPSVKAQEVIQGLIGTLDSISGIDDISFSSLAKLKTIEKMDFAGIMSSFVKQFSHKDFQAFTTKSTNINKYKLLQAQKNKELSAATSFLSGEELAKEKENIYKKYASKEQALETDPSTQAIQAVEGVIDIISSLGNLKEISVGAISRLKIVNKLGLGKEIGTILKDISKSLQDAQTPDFKSALESLSGTVGAIDTFTKDFHKTIFQIVKLQLLRPGYWMKMLFSSLMFDMPSKISKEYKKMDDNTRLQALNYELNVLQNPSPGIQKDYSAIDAKRKEIASASSSVTKDPGTMFSRIIDSRLAGLKTVLDSMTGIGDTAKIAVKSVFKALPLVKLATTGMSMIIDSLFSLTKKIDKLLDKNAGKTGGFLKNIFGLNKPNINIKDEKQLSRESLLREQTSKIGTLISLVNAFGGISVDGLKQAALAFFVASKLKFHETFPKIAGAAYSGLVFFKDIKLSETKEFKQKLIDVLCSISSSIKDLGKAAVFSKLAEKTIDSFEIIIKRLKNFIEKMKRERTDISPTQGRMFEGVKTIVDSLKGIGKSIVSLALVTPFIPIAMVGLMFVVGTIMLLTKIGKNKEVKHGVHVSLSIATGIIGFILKMALAGFMTVLLAPLIAVGLALVFGVVKFFQHLGSIRTSHNLSKGVHGLVKLALGIAFFTLVLIIASTAMVSASLKIIAGLGFLMLTTFIFLLIGKFDKHIRHGAEGVLMMGLSLAVFAIAMFIMGRAFPTPMSIVGAALGIVLLLGYTFVFSLIGKRFSDIVKGTFSVIAMSVGIAVFGVSLTILSNIVSKNKIDFVSIAIMVGLIAGFGLTFALVGQLASSIIIGSAAIIVMSGALFVFGLAFEKIMKSGFDKMTDKSWDGILNIAKLIGGFAVEFAIIGAPFVFPFVLLGAIGVGAMGVALSEISSGLKRAMEVDWKRIPIESIKTILVGLGEAFGAVGRENSGGLGLLGAGLNLIGIGPNNVKKGINAVLGASEALRDVASGLVLFDRMTKPLDLRVKKNEKGTYEPADGSLLQKIAVSLSVINKVFSDIGASGNTNSSLVGLIFGSDFKKSDTEVGINSVINAGKALMSVGIGLRAFDQLTKDIDLRSNWNAEKKMYEPAKDSVPHKIATVLSVVNKVFSDIGASGNTNSSLVGLIFGSDFKKSDTEVGINSVINAGKALMSVASGLRGFDTLTKELDLKTSGTKDGYPIPAIGSVPHKITTVLGIINKVFSDIGASGNSNNSYLGLIFGSDFKKSDTEVGIESVLKAGEALTGIAKGLKAFDVFTKDLDFDGSKDKGIGDTAGSPTSIQGKVSMVIGMISKIFGDIGKKKSGGGLLSMFGLDFSESDVEDGIESIKGVGEEFSGIANGLKIWGDIEKQGFNLTKISENVAKVLTMIGSVFADIGKMDSSSLLSEGDVENGVEAVQGISQEFVGIAEGLKGFVDLEKQGIKLDVLTRNISGVLTAVANVFSGIGSGEIVDFDGKLVAKVDSDSIQKGIESVQGLGTELKGVSDSLKGFSDLSKSGIDLKTISGNIKDILRAVGSAFEEIGKTSGNKTLKADPYSMTNMLSDTSNNNVEKTEYYGTDAIKKGVDAVKGLGTELANIANGLKPFMDLQKEKIDITKLGNNIKEVLTVVAKVFEEIGSKSGEPIEVDMSMMSGNSTQKISEFSGTAAIARGVKSVEGVGTVLKGIADMLRPFMDMQKTEDGKKPINIKTIKKNIAEMITLTADIFAALGGDVSAQGRIKTETGVTIAELNAVSVEAVMPTIQKAQEGLKLISDVGNLSNSIDPKKWEKMKDILPAMAMMPVNIFTEIGSVYEKLNPSQIMELVDNILPKLINRINEIVTSQNILANSIKGFNSKNSPLSSLGSDMKKFLNDVSRPPSDAALDRVNRTVQFVERFSAIAPQFKTFQESYSKHVKDVKYLIDNVNKLHNAQFDRYIKLQEVVKDMVTASTTQVQNNVSAIVSLLGQETKFLEKAALLTEQMKTEQQNLNQTTIGQEEYLRKLDEKDIRDFSQVELLQIIAMNSEETARVLKGKIKVAV